MQGAGTKDNPYVLSTPQDIKDIDTQKVSNVVSGYYVLGNDIDMSTISNFDKLVLYFEAELNGQGYAITNLTMNHSGSQALFYEIRNTTIKNLKIEDADITGGTNSSILTAYTKDSILDNVVTTGKINAQSTYVSGLTARSARTRFKNCYADVDLIHTGSNSTGNSGGFVSNSYGDNTFTNCFSSGRVIGNTPSKNRGFVGRISSSGDTFNSVYFDSDKAGTTASVDGDKPLTSAQFKQQDSFKNWDFATVWQMGEKYPTLRLFSDAPLPELQTVEVDSHINKLSTDVLKNTVKTNIVHSYILPHESNVERHTATLNNVGTFISNIAGDVTQSHRSVRTSTQEVYTFVSPISSGIERQKALSTMFTNSYINPIRTGIKAIIPFNDEVVNAYVSWIDNPSNTAYQTNATTLSHIENPSILEVIK